MQLLQLNMLNLKAKTKDRQGLPTDAHCAFFCLVRCEVTKVDNLAKEAWHDLTQKVLEEAQLLKTAG